MTINTEKLIIWIGIGLFCCSLIYILEQPTKDIYQIEIKCPELPTKDIDQIEIKCPELRVPLGAYDELTGTIYVFTELLEKDRVEHVLLHEYGHYLGLDENQAEDYANNHYIAKRK